MRVAHVVNTLPPYWSGTGLVALNLAQAIARRGHEIHIFTPLTADNRKVHYEQISVHKQQSIFRIGWAPLTPGILSIRQFDLIHLHFPYYFGAELVLLNSVLRKIPYVITYHNDVFKPGLAGKLVQYHTKHIAPLILRKAARICVMSRRFSEISVSLKNFAESDKVQIIPQGVDVRRFSPDAGTIGDNDGEMYILFVRMLDQAHHHSGLSYLLQAMKEIKGVRLLVVGDGPLRESYEELASSLGVFPRVRFLGAVDNQDLPAIYSAARAFILPSEETENAGLVIMEAMACSVPIVATDVGGTSGIVRTGVDGILVPPRNAHALAQAINSLLSNPDMAQQMGIAGREYVVESSSWDRVAGQYEEVYGSISCASE